MDFVQPKSKGKTFAEIKVELYRAMLKLIDSQKRIEYDYVVATFSLESGLKSESIKEIISEMITARQIKYEEGDLLTAKAE